MAAAAIDKNGNVTLPLDDFTREIAREAAREVVGDHRATCPLWAEVKSLKEDIYGLPGNKDRSPGLMCDVADLRRSRRMTILALRGAWLLLTILLGALLTALLQNHM